MAWLLAFLTVLVCLLLQVLLGYWLRRRAPAEEAASWRQPAPPPVASAELEPVWVAGYQLPESLHYHPGHTWIRVLDENSVAVGIDDFARKLLGCARGVSISDVGKFVYQGEAAFTVQINGKTAQFVSPVSGRVTEINPNLGSRPELVTSDPYGQGWVCKLTLDHLSRNVRNLLSSTLARRWTEDCSHRLSFYLMALSGSVLCDGGEPAENFARELTTAEWRALKHEFLLM